MPLLCSLICLSLGTFGEKPLVADRELGQMFATRKRGIDHVLLLNKVLIGTWFDGERRVHAEYAVLLSPGLLSRWIGYLNLSDEAYAKFGRQVNGRKLAFVRLARLNTIDFSDGDEVDTGSPASLEGVRIDIGKGNIRGGPYDFAPTKMTVLQDVQDRHPHDLVSMRWDRILARSFAWPSPDGPAPADPEIRWGRNRVVSYLVELPTETEGNASAFGAFRIIERDRTRVIPFQMPKS